MEVTIPDLIAPIEAWRIWKVPTFHDVSIYEWDWDREQPQLQSYNGTVWGSRSVHAICRHLSDKNCRHAPCPPSAKGDHMGEGCGIYAYNDRETAQDRFEGSCNSMFGPQVWVMGRVLLWGEVYEYEQGYRAEFAQVDAIVKKGSHNYPLLINTLHEIYGFEVMS